VVPLSIFSEHSFSQSIEIKKRLKRPFIATITDKLITNVYLMNIC